MIRSSWRWLLALALLIAITISPAGWLVNLSARSLVSPPEDMEHSYLWQFRTESLLEVDDPLVKLAFDEPSTQQIMDWSKGVEPAEVRHALRARLLWNESFGKGADVGPLGLVLQEARRTDPDNAFYPLMAAAVAQREGNLALAEEQMQAALKCGEFHARESEQIRQFIAAIERARGPVGPYVRDLVTFGWGSTLSLSRFPGRVATATENSEEDAYRRTKLALQVGEHLVNASVENDGVSTGMLVLAGIYQVETKSGKIFDPDKVREIYRKFGVERKVPLSSFRSESLLDSNPPPRIFDESAKALFNAPVALACLALCVVLGILTMGGKRLLEADPVPHYPLIARLPLISFAAYHFCWRHYLIQTEWPDDSGSALDLISTVSWLGWVGIGVLSLSFLLDLAVRGRETLVSVGIGIMLVVAGVAGMTIDGELYHPLLVVGIVLLLAAKPPSTTPTKHGVLGWQLVLAILIGTGGQAIYGTQVEHAWVAVLIASIGALPFMLKARIMGNAFGGYALASVVVFLGLALVFGNPRSEAYDNMATSGDQARAWLAERG